MVPTINYKSPPLRIDYVILSLEEIGDEIRIVKLPLATQTLRSLESNKQVALRIITEEVSHIIGLQFIHLPKIKPDHFPYMAK